MNLSVATNCDYRTPRRSTWLCNGAKLFEQDLNATGPIIRLRMRSDHRAIPVAAQRLGNRLREVLGQSLEILNRAETLHKVLLASM